ncbi:hypothetical protein H2248_000075 [Termitomyces sp. 'cryptogamus']|nr:hypothetical protein H2248_000075 [Termitomyces sp. 'cryptogamus']
MTPGSGISRQGLAILALAPIVLTLRRLYLRSLTLRTLKVLENEERVLVLGGSSGIGESIAKQYAERGARVCVVGRRTDKIAVVVEECRAVSSIKSPTRVLGVVADFAKVEDMVKLRETLQKEWQGVDTLIVAAGVSALQPLMAIAGIEADPSGTSFTPSQASIDGIKRAAEISVAATRGNYTGPLIAAVTFVRSATTPLIDPKCIIVTHRSPSLYPLPHPRQSFLSPLSPR